MKFSFFTLQSCKSQKNPGIPQSRSYEDLRFLSSGKDCSNDIQRQPTFSIDSFQEKINFFEYIIQLLMQFDLYEQQEQKNFSEIVNECRSNRDFIGRTLLHKFVVNGSIKQIDLVLQCIAVDEPDDLRRTPLFDAVENRNLSSVRLLIKHGADMKKTDLFGNNVFHMAVESDKNFFVLKYLLIKAREFCILDSMDKPDDLGQTPLFDAIENGILSSVKLLIESGADMKKTDHFGNSVFHMAVKKDKNWPVLKYLLEKAEELDISDIASKSNGMFTPIDIAVSEFNVEAILLFKAFGYDLSKSEKYFRKRRILGDVDSELKPFCKDTTLVFWTRNTIIEQHWRKRKNEKLWDDFQSAQLGFERLSYLPKKR